MRELHWHPNTDEWQYYIEGRARMGVFGASGQARTFDFEENDVGYVPFAMGHYIENTCLLYTSAMPMLEWVLVLLLAAVVLTNLAERLAVPYPSLLAVAGAGLALSLIHIW